MYTGGDLDGSRLLGASYPICKTFDLENLLTSVHEPLFGAKMMTPSNRMIRRIKITATIQRAIGIYHDGRNLSDDRNLLRRRDLNNDRIL
jgi:hypothetical protein